MKARITMLAALSIVALAAFAGSALADRGELSGVDEQQSSSSGVHRSLVSIQADSDGASIDATVISDHKGVGVRAEADRKSRTAEVTPCAAFMQVSVCKPITITVANANANANREPEFRLPVSIIAP